MIEKLWVAEAQWVDTSHGKNCDTCHGKMEMHTVKFERGVEPPCVCPASEDFFAKCICVTREATNLERMAYVAGCSSKSL